MNAPKVPRGRGINPPHVPGGSRGVVIASYLDERGFVPRVYRVLPDGYPIAKVDGPHGFRTWEEAAEASRFLVAPMSSLARESDRSP